jgi:uncharacterized protein (TIGR00369 family)
VSPGSRADRHAPLPAEVAEHWMRFGKWSRTYFVNLLGIEVEEVRTDYCRMRLPFRAELLRPGGLVHGGAIATLLDSVVVPAVGSAYRLDAVYATVDMHVQFIGAVREGDVVAEGWVVRRGRTVVFVEAEARAAETGRMVARSVLTYHVRADAVRVRAEGVGSDEVPDS